MESKYINIDKSNGYDTRGHGHHLGFGPIFRCSAKSSQFYGYCIAQIHKTHVSQ